MVINTLGRRKTSVARLYMKQGSGNFLINGRSFEDYFPSEVLRLIVCQPLELTGNMGKFDIKVNLDGGGIKGQAEALRLAISRALLETDAETRKPLKVEGFLTRDPRMVEIGRASCRERV